MFWPFISRLLMATIRLDSESWSHPKITRPLFNATANQKTRFLLISRLGGTKTSSPDFVTLSASENKGGSASGAKPWRSFDLERERGAEARVLRSMLLR